MDQERFASGLIAAHEDARRIRALLTEHAEGRDDPSELLESVTEHWRHHSGTYKTAGTIVLNQLRSALLSQLYGWRHQLSQQLQAQARQQRTRPRGTRPSPRGRQPRPR